MTICGFRVSCVLELFQSGCGLFSKSFTVGYISWYVKTSQIISPSKKKINISKASVICAQKNKNSRWNNCQADIFAAFSELLPDRSTSVRINLRRQPNSSHHAERRNCTRAAKKGGWGSLYEKCQNSFHPSGYSGVSVQWNSSISLSFWPDLM